MDLIKINLGCGHVRPAGWINTDSSWNANLQRSPFLRKIVVPLFKHVVYKNHNLTYMNLNRTWKWGNDSVDIVYASHLYEHLTLDSARLMLRESFRCLKPGGVIRLVVPDLFKLCKKYILEFENQNSKASESLLWALNLHREGQYGKLNFLKKLIFEIQGYPHQHKYMYDSRSLSEKLLHAGFMDLKECRYGQSVYMESCIKEVEGNVESYLSVYLEALKPF
ncbi:MAG TPA: methyltransferase domain-containing protein [Saprospiraceae bacterium]|nr:methyltransferase domain-containing protein [Saprospiraceae bacterium]HNT19448.1 methyltransferase domain-containing protein [Saprospiraceae bacterium]